MEKKYIMIGAGVAASVTAIAVGVGIKHFVLDSKKDVVKSNVKKMTISVADHKSLAKAVNSLGKKAGVDLADEQIFALVGGITLWGIKNGKEELTPSEVVKAANWASKRNGLGVAFKM